MALPAVNGLRWFALTLILIVELRSSTPAGLEYQPFNIPAGPADLTLKIFAEESGKQVLYTAKTVQGVKTNPVKGDYSPDQALACLVSGTTLAVAKSTAGGAFAIVARSSLAAGSRNSPPETGSQTPSQEGSSDQAAAQEIVKLGMFEVQDTQDVGYYTSTSAASFKTNQSTMNIPQLETTITRSLIDDTAALYAGDMTKYAGVPDAYGLEDRYFSMRGFRIAPLIDEMPMAQISYYDSVFIDNITVVKGPASVFYAGGVNTLGGIVLFSSRRPLPYERNDLSFEIMDGGNYRAVIDSTGPMLKTANGTCALSYRVDAVLQNGNQYFDFQKDNRKVIGISLQYNNNKGFSLLVRFAQYYVDDTISNDDGLVDYQGKAYAPGGDKRAAMWILPGGGGYGNEWWDQNLFFLEASQQIASNWEVKAAGHLLNDTRYGSLVVPNSYPNWATMTTFPFFRLNDQYERDVTMQLDVTGKYNLGPIPAQTTLGLRGDDEEMAARYPSTFLPASYPNPGCGSGAFSKVYYPAISLNNPKWYETYPAFPTAGDYGGGYGQFAFDDITTIGGYFQESIDLIPKYLSLVGALAREWNQILSESNHDIPSQDVIGLSRTYPPTLHRYGVVLHLNKDISLYALNSTTAAGAPQIPYGAGTPQIFPGQDGQGEEAGLKVNLFHDHLFFDLAFFDDKVTNQLVNSGIPATVQTSSGPTQEDLFENVGSTESRGFDVDLGCDMELGRGNMQMIASFDRAPQRTHPGSQPVANGLPEDNLGLYTKYTPDSDTPLGKFSVGFGYAREFRILSPEAGVFPAGETASTVYLQEGDQTDGFISYKPCRHWAVTLNCQNIFNEFFPVAGVGTNAGASPVLEPGRTLVFKIGYRF